MDSKLPLDLEPYELCKRCDGLAHAAFVVYSYGMYKTEMKNEGQA